MFLGKIKNPITHKRKRDTFFIIENLKTIIYLKNTINKRQMQKINETGTLSPPSVTN